MGGVRTGWVRHAGIRRSGWRTAAADAAMAGGGDDWGEQTTTAAVRASVVVDVDVDVGCRPPRLPPRRRRSPRRRARREERRHDDARPPHSDVSDHRRAVPHGDADEARARGHETQEGRGQRTSARDGAAGDAPRDRSGAAPRGGGTRRRRRRRDAAQRGGRRRRRDDDDHHGGGVDEGGGGDAMDQTYEGDIVVEVDVVVGGADADAVAG